MSLSFLTLGVGDAFSARRYSSCLAVEAEGQALSWSLPVWLSPSWSLAQGEAAQSDEASE